MSSRSGMDWRMEHKGSSNFVSTLCLGKCYYHRSISLICLLITNLVLSCCDGASLNYSRYGQINIGGLFPLHFYNEPERQCGDLREIGSLRRIEAMVFAIENINQNSSVLNNITLGFEIYDTCSYLAESLSKSLNFIPPYRKSIACDCDDLDADQGGLPRIFGIVGAQRSSSSLQSTLLLGLYDIPQVSYLSTSDELSNDERYPYFLRTVPPDRFQVQAMIDILKRYNWKYVAFINSDDTYGKSAQQEFRLSAPLFDICLAFARTISESAEEYVFDDVINELLEMQEESQVTSVILFMQVEMARRIFAAATTAEATRQFIWIGSDGWGNYDLQPVQGYEEAALGCFTVLPLSGNLPTYDEYFRSIQKSTSDNPWLDEYIEAYGVCNDTSVLQRISPDPECKPFDLMDVSDSPTHETLVIDSVNALAYALHNLHKDVCPDTPTTLCEAMTKVKGGTLKDYILNVEWISQANGKVAFLSNGDTQGKYSVRNLQKVDGVYQFVDVGKWKYSEGGSGLTIANDTPWYIGDFRERDPDTGAPKSICRDPCAAGEKQTLFPENPCCWTCTRCKVDEIVTENGTKCVSCVNETAGMYEWPVAESQYTLCEPIDPKDSLRENVLGIVVVVFSSAGLVLNTLIMVVYVKNREEPLIKASSRELCYVIFTGIYLAYIVALANGLPPRSITCVIRRIGPVLATSLIYIPLCTKTIRLYRIFNAGKKSAGRPKFISPGFQMTLTFTLASIPCAWSVAWIVVAPPHVEVLMPFSDQPLVELTCADSIVASVGITIWDVTVVLVCCFYAFMTRKLPDNYNETRFITFCVFSTLVVYATFSPAYYTAAEARYKAAYTALGLIIQSTVALICLFTVKIYALYFVDDEEMHIFTQTRIRANTRNSINRVTNDSPSHIPAPTGSRRVAPASCSNMSFVGDDEQPRGVHTISGNGVANQNNNAHQRNGSTQNRNSGGQRNGFLPTSINRVESIEISGVTRSTHCLTKETANGDNSKKRATVTFQSPTMNNIDQIIDHRKLTVNGTRRDGTELPYLEENC